MMRLLLLVLGFLTAVAASPTSAAQRESDVDTGRVTTSLDAGWLFKRGEVPMGAAADFDDSKWDQVTLPHTFNGSDGEDGGGFYRGPGWYRRTLRLSAEPKGRVFLQFDGAALRTEAFINGVAVGRHDGGHARFRFDVTDALRAGQNLIAVRVDNGKFPHIAPLGGDFTLFGGLYRSVHLIETGTSHIEMVDHGSPGIRAVVKSLTDDRAEVEVIANVRNSGARAERLSLSATIHDAAGRLVARGDSRTSVEAGRLARQRIPLRVQSPRRWNGRKDPHLYRVTLELRGRDGSLLDQTSVPLGFRTFSFDAQRGFILNGEPYPLNGVNLFHSGRPGRGLAVTDEEIAADMQILDELGVTAIRFVHFQHPERAYEEADRRGMVVWTEIGLNGVIDPGPGFTANISQQMRELIRQTYNHPSVVLWGLGNEVYSTDPAVTRALQVVQAVAKAEDPSRPTIYAHCCQGDDDPKARVSDVIAFNRYFGWYPGQSGTIGEWADGFHAKFPDKPFVVGEYGAGGSIRHQQVPPPEAIVTTSGWHPEQFQTRYHEENWRELAAREYLGGRFVWVAFDLASDGRGEGDRPGINDKGLISYDRAVRKDAYYWYQANWSAKPMVHIADRRHDRRRGANQDIKAYSNVGPLTLFINGREAGVQQPQGRIALWRSVQLQPGRNQIQVRGPNVSDTIEWEVVHASGIGASPVPEVYDRSKPKATPTAPPGQ